VKAGSFVHRVPVRFRDVDAMGHAHHTFPLICIEEARAAFWRSLAGPSLEDIDYVLGEVQVRFLGRIFYPGTIEVGLRVAELGRSRFVLEYELRDAAGGVVAEARTTQVMYDYAASASRPIPEALRARLAERLVQSSVASSAEPSPMKAPST
jgi:acyl-CoA thioester hydrolase